MAPKTNQSSSIPFYRDERVLQLLGQVVVLVLVAGLLYYLVTNLIVGLESQGIRMGFEMTPKLGTSNLASSMSGNRDSLPAPTQNTGTSRILSRLAARAGGSPVFQSPSDSNTMPRRF